MSGQQGACPQCGAPLRFGAGQSVAAVCSYCRSSVARRGVTLELVGKVPDLVSTSTVLALRDAGTFAGTPFVIVGRLQLDQGAAAWDEWYLQFADGSDGWLAEAQGALLITRRAPASAGPLPKPRELRPGEPIALPGTGQLVVQELGKGRIVSAEGELPEPPRPGTQVRFADLSGEDGAFATLDYGAAGEEATLYSGHRLSYEEAGLGRTAEARRREAGTAPPGPRGTALVCPSCHAPVPLRHSQSASVGCPSCGSLLDVQDGALALVGKLERRSVPVVPLGSKGTLRGQELTVLGYLRRFVEVEGVEYEWSEWQCHCSAGYRYLSEYAGHWTLLWPVPAGEVQEYKDRAAAYAGRAHRHFQSGIGNIREIQGEFSWNVRIEDQVAFRDYVAPPWLISREDGDNEVNWTAGEHLEGSEVWAAFRLAGKPPAVVGVGPVQPNRWVRPRAAAWKSALLAIAALVALAFFEGSILPHQKLLQLEVPLVDDGVTLSEPFDLPAASQAVAVSASAPMNQAWAGLDAVLINDETGDAHSVELQLSHFEGVDDGERWTEGSRYASEVIDQLPAGRYLLRVDVTLDPASRAQVPPAASVGLERGPFLWVPWLLGLALLLPAPILLSVLHARFERLRWEESDHDGVPS